MTRKLQEAIRATLEISGEGSEIFMSTNAFEIALGKLDKPDKPDKPSKSLAAEIISMPDVSFTVGTRFIPVDSYIQLCRERNLIPLPNPK